jgi:hypothetical protein
MATVQEEDGGHVKEDRGENLTSGDKDFDSPTLKRLERHFPPSLNLEHIKYGKINTKDIPKVKAKIGVLAGMALIAAGEPTAQIELEVESMEFVANRLVDLAENGFNAKVGISTQTFNYNMDSTKQGGGVFHRIRHPLGGGQQQTPGVQ